LAWNFIDHSHSMFHEMLNETFEISDPEAHLLNTGPSSFQKTANGRVLCGRLQEFNAGWVAIALFIGVKEPGDHTLIFDGFIVCPLGKTKQRPKRRCSLQIRGGYSNVIQGDGSVRHLSPSKSAWWRVFSKDVTEHATDFSNGRF
jgi:hypothetical protein